MPRQATAMTGGRNRRGARQPPGSSAAAGQKASDKDGGPCGKVEPPPAVLENSSRGRPLRLSPLIGGGR